MLFLRLPVALSAGLTSLALVGCSEAPADKEAFEAWRPQSPVQTVPAVQAPPASTAVVAQSAEAPPTASVLGAAPKAPPATAAPAAADAHKARADTAMAEEVAALRKQLNALQAETTQLKAKAAAPAAASAGAPSLARASPPAVIEPTPIRLAPYHAPGLPRADTCSGVPYLAQLPAKTRWFGASDYNGGSPSPLRFEGSKHAVRVAVVQVSEPGPVALVLSAYEPNVWVVEQAKGTQVVAVVATGYHLQRVTGVAPNVPIVLTSYEGGSPCGSGYQGIGQALLVQQLAGAKLESTIKAAPVTLIGVPRAPFSRAPGSPPPEAFGKATQFKPGAEGIKEALEKGFLRSATAEDMAQLPRSLAQTGAAHVLVVTKAMELPPDLYGGNGGYYVFFVPKGVPLPTGDSGHTSVFSAQTRSCVGAIQCRLD